MQQRNTLWLFFIVLLVAAAIAIVAIEPCPVPFTDLKVSLHQGLDLQGGIQVLLEADLPAEAEVKAASMSVAQRIVEQRVNGLGVTEPVVQAQGSRRIVVELPGISDPKQAIDTLKQTGLLEFVYSPIPLEEDTIITTDCLDPSKIDCGGTGAAIPLTPTAAIPVGGVVPTATTIYHTVLTGAALDPTKIYVDAQTGYAIDFTFQDAGAKIFGDFTTQHVNEYLAIVLDKKVVSSPVIRGAITGGKGQISGNFTNATANKLALQLKYGSLPIPLKVVQSREIGPTLGQDSVRKSLIAGILGLTAVVLFMLLYYRLPGVIADLALLIYAVITIALFKLIPVTLTLPAIAGFVLSVGVAVDANILIFERMKEELRAGKNLRSAVEAGFSRAWPSIRDSNISTLITCAILFWFGNQFGASIVKGFALTLALGVGVSLFTAILVTRSILHLFLDRIDFSSKHGWFGI